MIGNTIEHYWTYLYKDVFHENEFSFFVNGSFAVMNIFFWGISFLFMIVDVTGRPKWVLKYKVQPGENQPVKLGLLWKAIKLVFVNHLFITLPMIVVSYRAQQYMGCSCKVEDLPSFWRVLRDVIGCAAIGEIIFYHGHRFAHWGPLYRHVHKVHHEWTSPMGVAAAYAHPLEHVFCNVLPLMAGPILMRTHLFTTFIWIYIGVSTTIVNHSDYHLPFMSSPEAHDYHHLKFNVNYGSAVGILDRLYGTDKQFRGTKQKQRHRMLFGLTPMRERIPDEKQTNQ